MTGKNTEMPYTTRDLVRLGFESVAIWKIDSTDKERIAYEAIVVKEDSKPDIFNVKNALYAFCFGEDVFYIGKTSRGLTRRFAGYCRPGVGQRTNLKCNALIRAEIAKERKVEIFAFAPEKDLRHCEFQINLAAGLEDILIDEFNPPWNGGPSGAKFTESAEHEVNLVMQESVPDGLPEQIPEIGHFYIELGKTYYYRGVINPGKKVRGLLGKQGEGLTIMFSDGMPSVGASINVNDKGAVRLVGSRQVIADWFQKNFKEKDTVRARILGPHLIELMQHG